MHHKHLKNSVKIQLDDFSFICQLFLQSYPHLNLLPSVLPQLNQLILYFQTTVGTLIGRQEIHQPAENQKTDGAGRIMDNHHDDDNDWLGDVDFDNSEFISSKAQFGGSGGHIKPSRLSTSLNEDTYDYALLLVPDDEYRQAAASLPRISEYEDLDEELLLYGGAVGRKNSSQQSTSSSRDPHHRLSRAFLAAVRQSFGSSKRSSSSGVSSLLGQRSVDNDVVVEAPVADVEQGGTSSPLHHPHHLATTDTPSPASSLSSASVITSHQNHQRGVPGVNSSHQRTLNHHRSRGRISPEQSSSITQVISLAYILPLMFTLYLYPRPYHCPEQSSISM